MSAPPPPHLGSPGVMAQDQRSSARAIIFISLALIALCAAMGAYVSGRGAGTRSEVTRIRRR